MVQHFVVPYAEEFLQLWLEIRRKRPGCSQGWGTWSRFSAPPFNGGIDGIHGRGFEKVLGCCLLSGEEHSKEWGHHHLNEASSFVRIAPWCLTLRRGWWCSSRRFWNREDDKFWRTIWGVNLCLARRQRVAKPHCELVLRRGFLRIPFFGWKNWQMKG